MLHVVIITPFSQGPGYTYCSHLSLLYETSWSNPSNTINAGESFLAFASIVPSVTISKVWSSDLDNVEFMGLTLLPGGAAGFNGAVHIGKLNASIEFIPLHLCLEQKLHHQ